MRLLRGGARSCRVEGVGNVREYVVRRSRVRGWSFPSTGKQHVVGWFVWEWAGCASTEPVECDGVDSGAGLGGHADEIVAALPAQLVDHWRFAELLDEQVQVSSGHIGA